MVDNKERLSNEEDMSQVLGSIILNGDILYNSKYPLEPKDFIKEYALVFSCVSNLIKQGVRHFDDNIILEQITINYPSYIGVYKELYPDNNFVEELVKKVRISNLDYHYDKLRKMSYLRDLETSGFDISKFYDVGGKNTKLNQKFENSTVEDLINSFKLEVLNVNSKWVTGTEDEEELEASSIEDKLLDEVLEGDVEVGHKYPMGLEVLTHIYRGQLPQKYNLNLASSGCGKSRIKMLQALNNACEYMYDTSEKKWQYIGESKPTLFISTEVTLKSLLSMAIAIISGVEESKIKRRKYNDEEKDRIKKARYILKKSRLFFKYMPNFTIESIEACVEQYLLTKKIEFVYFDYIHVTASVMNSITKKTGNKSLGTDKILEAFSTELKNITNRFYANFNTSSQVNRNSTGDEGKSLASARGAFSLADKYDTVMYSENPKRKDIEKFKSLNIYEGFLEPNFAITILKNRDGEDNNITLWFNLNKGNMRFNFLGCTDKDITEEYNLLIDKYAYEREESEDLEMLEFLAS